MKRIVMDDYDLITSQHNSSEELKHEPRKVLRSSSKARLGGPTPTAMIPGSMIKEESSEEEMSFEKLNGDNSPINNEIEMTT